jgi:hypothetical protein
VIVPAASALFSLMISVRKSILEGDAVTVTADEAGTVATVAEVAGGAGGADVGFIGTTTGRAVSGTPTLDGGGRGTAVAAGC